jgi:hypothetical protein
MRMVNAAPRLAMLQCKQIASMSRGRTSARGLRIHRGKCLENSAALIFRIASGG